MKIRVLGAFGGEGLGHRPSSFLVNNRILIDGGSVTGALTVPQQLAIEHAIISHAHLDHVAGLVYLTETLAFCEVLPLSDQDVQQAQSEHVVRAPVRAKIAVPLQLVPNLIAALQEHMRIYSESTGASWDKGPIH